jgi:two-component system sensor histidine kinase DesK
LEDGMKEELRPGRVINWKGDRLSGERKWRNIVPRSREARTALVTSWVVVAYLLASVVVAVLVESALSLPVRVLVVALVLSATACLLRLQSVALADPHRRPSCAVRWLAVVLCLLMLPFPETWVMVSVAFAALLLSPAGRVQALSTGAILTGVVELAVLVSASRPSAALVVPLITWLTAAIFYILTRMTVVLEQLRVTREHLARIQVDEERHRVSRDLHDILGRTLVVASLRTQTAMRLVDRGACRRELEHAADAVARAQTELRRLVRGDVAVCLEQEIEAAGALFDRLGIEHEFDVSHVEDHDTSVIVACAVREAVTNMLKHSRPRCVVIRVQDRHGVIRMTAVNDGAPKQCAAGEGTGLPSLTRRVELVGGSLDSGPDREGRYRMAVEVPRPFLSEKEPA